MLSTFQIFLLTSSIATLSLTLPANQSEVVEAKATTNGDLNATQVTETHNLTEVTNSTTDSGGQSKNSSTDSTINREGQNKISSDNKPAEKSIGDPLVMTPESLAKNSSDNNNNKSDKEANNNNTKSKEEAKEAADPLVMMPESLTDAGDKARLWLNQNNQMVLKLCSIFNEKFMHRVENTTF